MVHATFLEAYIHFALMYTTYHIFLVLPIKGLIIDEGNLTTQFKLKTGKKPSVSYLCLLFCSYVAWKATTHVGTKALNMRHQAQNGFRGFFVGIPQHRKGYLVYVPSASKIISSYDVVFYESFSSALAYTSQPYSESMDMRPYVTSTTCDTSSMEQNGNIITFSHFENGN